MTRTSRSVDLGLLGVAVVWGSSYLAAKSATQAAPIEVVVFGRYAVAAVACLLIAAVLARKRYSPSFTRAELAAGAVLGTTQAAVLALETWGVAGTSASNAGVLISLTLILTPLIEGRLGVSLPAQLWVAAGVCLVGVLLLVGSSASITDPRPGDLLVLLAAVVRAGHVVLIGRVSARASVALRPLQLTTVQVCVGTMWALPFAAGDLVESSHLLTDTRLWVAVGYLALGCSVFAFLAQT